MKKTTEVTVVPQKQDNVQMVATQQMSQAEMLISQAIEKNVPVDTMERLLAMRRELKAEAAKEAFDLAMSSFQGACPEIKKTKEVKTKAGVVAYRYAPIEVIVSQVKELLKDHGLSYSIKTETKPDGVVSTCVVKHMQGHVEEFSVAVPLGNKTDIMSNSQVVAAALTFAKRYAFCNAFGIMTGDEDVDGAKLQLDGQGATDAEFKYAMGGIAKMSRMECEKFKLKFAQSEKYTVEQKSELIAAIETRIATLKSAPNENPVV